MPHLRLLVSREPRRSPWTAFLGLLVCLALLPTSSALAGPLGAAGSHAGEDHAFEDHSAEMLRDIDLREADLMAIDLHGNDLKNALFDGADLREADLRDADLKNASFAAALLHAADLSGAYIKNGIFHGAVLLGADLSNVLGGDVADFDGAYYDGTTLLDPSIDVRGMLQVMGPCPGDASAVLVLGPDGLACESAEVLPEPGGAAMLLCGSSLLLTLRRRRPARRP